MCGLSTRRACVSITHVHCVYRRGSARARAWMWRLYMLYTPARCQRPFIGRHSLYALLIILIPRNFLYVYAPFVTYWYSEMKVGLDDGSNRPSVNMHLSILSQKLFHLTEEKLKFFTSCFYDVIDTWEIFSIIFFFFIWIVAEIVTKRGAVDKSFRSEEFFSLFYWYG